MNRKTVEVSLQQRLFQPFNFIAGLQAIFLGGTAVFITGVLAYLSNLHLDGIPDVHFGKDAPFGLFVVQGFINAFCAFVVFMLAALLLSKSKPRVADMLGTQLLARWPMLFVALGALLLPQKHVTAFLNYSYLKEGEVVAEPNSLQWIVFAVLILIIFICIIWMVALMFNGYAVSANLKGTTAVVSFIAALIIAVVLAELLHNQLYKFLLI